MAVIIVALFNLAIKENLMDKALETINSGLVWIFDNVLHAEAVSIAEEYKGKLSITEVHTIAAIGSGVHKSMGEVAGKLHITVGTLTVAVNNLVRKGYAKRYKSEKDRRIVKVGLTKQGEKVYYIHEKFHKDMADAMTAGLSDTDMDILAKVLSNINNFVACKKHQQIPDRSTNI